MALPFTTSQFFDVFARYNTTIWPAQVLLVALALAAAALAWKPGRWSGPAVAGLLAAQWCWTGIVYHWVFFSRINPAARAFAVVWLAGALMFASAVRGRRALAFRAEGWRTGVGAATMVYALAVYPLLGRLDGRVYPAAPTFGAPCPVTIFTIGLLWLVAGPLPRRVLVAPILWAAVGSVAAFTLGVYEDLGLLAAGLSGLVLLARPPAPV